MPQQTVLDDESSAISVRQYQRSQEMRRWMNEVRAATTFALADPAMSVGRLQRLRQQAKVRHEAALARIEHA